MQFLPLYTYPEQKHQLINIWRSCQILQNFKYAKL